MEIQTIQPSKDLMDGWKRSEIFFGACDVLWYMIYVERSLLTYLGIQYTYVT